MKKRKLLGTTTALALVTGCSMIALGNGVSPPGPTTLTVAEAAGGGCKITPPAPIDVKGRQSPLLMWRLSDPGKYKFAPNGIAFDKSAYKPPSGEFDPRGVNAQAAFIVWDKNHTKGRFDYSIHVIVKSNNKTCDVDPIIYNDGSCPDTGC